MSVVGPSIGTELTDASHALRYLLEAHNRLVEPHFARAVIDGAFAHGCQAERLTDGGEGRLDSLVDLPGVDRGEIVSHGDTDRNDLTTPVFAALSGPGWSPARLFHT